MIKNQPIHRFVLLGFLCFSVFMKKLKQLVSNWSSLLTFLPSGLEESAIQNKAIIRKREVKSASDLLRLLFGYSILGLSLQDISVWALQTGIAKISDVGLLKRFQKSVSWLRSLISHKLLEKTSFKASANNSLRIRIFDASLMNRPGSKGSDLRLHAGIDLRRLQVDHLELTSFKKGESLTNFTFNSGDVALCDRGYSHRRGVFHVVNSGADVIVRMCWQNFPLQYPNGKEFDLFSELRKLKKMCYCDIPVETRAEVEIPAISGRVIAIRKDPESAERARRKANRDAKKKGKQVKKETLEACDYTFIFTTLGESIISAEEVLELYRFRWQIELFFKRLKSILDFDVIKAKSDQLCEALLLSKLLALLIIEETMGKCNIFFSEKEDQNRPVSLWRIIKSLYKCIACAIGLISDLKSWINIFTKVADRFKDRPRKRQSQSARAMALKPLESELKNKKEENH